MTEVEAKLLRELQDRIQNCPKQVNNSSLYAGSPMFFYCQLCGHESDRLPESYTCMPKKHCAKCLELKEAHPGVSEQTLREMAIHMPLLPP
jgi:hypothetical protein